MLIHFPLQIIQHQNNTKKSMEENYFSHLKHVLIKSNSISEYHKNLQAQRVFASKRYNNVTFRG